MEEIVDLYGILDKINTIRCEKGYVPIYWEDFTVSVSRARSILEATRKYGQARH